MGGVYAHSALPLNYSGTAASIGLVLGSAAHREDSPWLKAEHNQLPVHWLDILFHSAEKLRLDTM